MVGVPGRSKGCNTCIRRKIKCDGGRPQCGTCQKAHRLCTGYNRPLTFVLPETVAFEPGAIGGAGDNTIVTKGRWRKQSSLPLRRAAKAISVPADAGPAPIHEADADKGAASAEHTPIRSKPSSPGSDLSSMVSANAKTSSTWTVLLPGKLPSDAAWREQLLPVYMQFHLPAESRQSACPQSRAALAQRNWLLQVQDDPGLAASPALDAAMTALVLARVGRRNGHTGLVRHAAAVYTRGLQQLRAAMRNDATRLSDHTLAACVALSLYEVAECPSGAVAAYSAHHTGALVLLRLRGPPTHWTPLGHALFVFLRMQHFIFALESRSGNFLGRGEWLEQAFMKGSGDPRDRFMDQMYGIIALFEQEDALACSDPGPATLAAGYLALLARYRAIYACLQGWFRAMQDAVPGPLYWPELSTITYPELDASGAGRPFPVAFHFPAFSVGQGLILFWLVSMVANFSMAKLHQKVANLLPPTGHDADPILTPTPSPPSEPAAAAAAEPAAPAATPEAQWTAAAECITRGTTMAHNICQSVEHFLDDSMGEVGTLTMLLPLLTVRGALSNIAAVSGAAALTGDRIHNTDALAWIDVLLKQIGARGQQLALHLDNA